MTKITLFPTDEQGPYGANKPISFKEYLGDMGFSFVH